MTMHVSGGKVELLECVFGDVASVNGCDACKGTGNDALGTCPMCGGRPALTCMG